MARQKPVVLVSGAMSISSASLSYSVIVKILAQRQRLSMLKFVRVAGVGMMFNGPSRICCAVAGIVKKYNEISGIVCKKRLKKLPNPKGPLF